MLADALLGGHFTEFVLMRRKAGLSWRRIALALRDETGLDVTGMTLSNWFASERPDAVYPDAQRDRPSA
jgi:hypothetical protein